MEIKDQLNNILVFDKSPQRIISLVPSQTELLVDLNLENHIVGITKFCIHPSRIKNHKTIVGGTKKVNYQKIKGLQPDVIICNKEENTKEIVVNLQKIAPVYVSDIYTISDVIQLFLDFGVLFNKETVAQKLVDELQNKLTNFTTFIKEQSVKKAAYFIWSKPWMVSGGNNFINELLKLNKFENIFENQDRYPEVDLNTIAALKPDLILLSSEPYPFKKEHKEQLEKFTNAKIIFVDGEFFSWYGSRLLQSFDYFKILH